MNVANFRSRKREPGAPFSNALARQVQSDSQLSQIMRASWKRTTSSAKPQLAPRETPPFTPLCAASTCTRPRHGSLKVNGTRKSTSKKRVIKRFCWAIPWSRSRRSLETKQCSRQPQAQARVLRRKSLCGLWIPSLLVGPPPCFSFPALAGGARR